MTDAASEAPSTSGSDVRSSAVALGVGIVIALVTSKLFSALGWTGELASQVAGAASGAAPLLLDAVRQRQKLRSRFSRAGIARLRAARPPLLVAAMFGWALLLFDTVSGWAFWNITELMIAQSRGDTARFLSSYLVIGGLVQIPILFVFTVWLGRWAAHRLERHKKRWIWLGMVIYAVVRTAQFLITNVNFQGYTAGLLVLTVVVVVCPILGGLAMVGVWRANRTQAAFNASVYFRQLPEEDQEAALALLGSDRPRPVSGSAASGPARRHRRR